MSVDRLSDGYVPDFDLDYEIGRQGELFTVDIVEAFQRDAVEVKTDEQASRTGNVFVEYECRRRDGWHPSGIATTEAVAWVFVLVRDSLMLVIDTNHLKAVARECHKRGQTRPCSRGSHPTRGVVVPIRSLIVPAE